MATLRHLYTYLHPDIDPEGGALEDSAKALITTPHTYDVLWASDALDGVESLDAAVALAISMATIENKLAEVRVSTDADGDDDDEWEDACVFAAGPSRAGVEKAAR